MKKLIVSASLAIGVLMAFSVALLPLMVSVGAQAQTAHDLPCSSNAGAVCTVPGSVAATTSVSAQMVAGGVNGGLAASQNSLKQDARMCRDVTATNGLASIISAGCAGFGAADVGKVVILWASGTSRQFTGKIASVQSTKAATLSATYTGATTARATMILGTDDGAAFNTMVSSGITANSGRGELSLGCKPIITTVPLVIAGRSTQLQGCSLASGLLAGVAAGSNTGTTIIWAGTAHAVTLSAVVDNVVTLTDSAGHGFYTGSYCSRTSGGFPRQCLVDIQGATQAGNNGTHLVLSVPNTTTLTYYVANSTLTSDSGYIPVNDVLTIQNCYGCGVHHISIMGSDQPSSMPRALINTVDLSGAGYVTTNAVDKYDNIFGGNLGLVPLGNMPGNSALSTSTAEFGILADPRMAEDDRQQFENVHFASVDVCFGAEQSQPDDWTFSGTIGCQFSGAGFASLDGAQWHVSGTYEGLQNGVDFLLGGAAHLDVAKYNIETDGPAKINAPQIGGPGDQPGSEMMAEFISPPGSGVVPGGTLAIDHGFFYATAAQPNGIIGIPTYVSATGGSYSGTGTCIFSSANGGGAGGELLMKVTRGAAAALSRYAMGSGYTSEPTTWNYVSGAPCSAITSITTSGGSVIGDMTWSSIGSGTSIILSDFQLKSGGGAFTPVVTPIVDLSTIAGGAKQSFVCKPGCSGFQTNNFNVTAPHNPQQITIVENDSPVGPGLGESGKNILQSGDPLGVDDFRVDQVKTRIFGDLIVPQITSPVYISNLTCAASGTTTYYYKVTSVTGGLESPPNSEWAVSNCSNTVSNTTYILGSIFPIVGADSYKFYRGTSSGSEAYAFTLPANTGYNTSLHPGGGNPFRFKDTVASPSGAYPSVNATGEAEFAYILPILETVSLGNACPVNGVIWLGRDGTTGLCSSNMLVTWPKGTAAASTFTYGAGAAAGSGATAPTCSTAIGNRCTTTGGILAVTTASTGTRTGQIATFGYVNPGNTIVCPVFGFNAAASALNPTYLYVSPTEWAINVTTAPAAGTTYYFSYGSCWH